MHRIQSTKILQYNFSSYFPTSKCVKSVKKQNTTGQVGPFKEFLFFIKKDGGKDEPWKGPGKTANFICSLGKNYYGQKGMDSVQFPKEKHTSKKGYKTKFLTVWAVFYFGSVILK